MAKLNSKKSRCAWAESDPLLASYHDQEWGKPVYKDEILFEFLTLEGAQAGLSWLTILKRRKGYQEAFHRFKISKVAQMTPKDVERLVKFEGIIRHRGKIESVISNAKAIIEIQKEFGSLSNFLWEFIGNKPKVNKRLNMKDLPSSTPESDSMSKALKKRGLKFVGSTICYAFMQAVGMVDDHLTSCFRSKKK